MNYQDIIQILYIILLVEIFVILLYVIVIIIDVKKSIDKIKLTLDKFQTVGNKALDIADNVEDKIQKMINFTDILGDIPNIIKRFFFREDEDSDKVSTNSGNPEKSEKLDDESEITKKYRPKIIRKRII